MSVDHIVIIVKENHTFDNYFGTFPGANGETLATADNPPTVDPDHKHQTWMKRALDVRFHVQYGQTDIPGYFDLAQRYTLCDNYHAEVAGPSTPNHLMLICADSPVINNPRNHYNPRAGDGYDLASLPLQLENAGKTWANYGGYAFHFINELAGHRNNHSRDLFTQDAMAGNLPNVSWVYGDGRPDLSEHPKQNVTQGSDWTRQQIDAIVQGGLWDKTMIFVTWDDWGGWYDHVEAPNVETWDSRRAQRPADAFPEFDGEQFRYGSRVGCLAIGPYAKPGFISHQLNSHVSLVRFCQSNFGLPPLNTRDGSSNAMTDCFDYTQHPNPAPPAWAVHP